MSAVAVGGTGPEASKAPPGLRTPRPPVSAWLARAEAYLAERGVEEVSANAEFLMAEALGCGRLEARAWDARVPTEKQANRFWHLVKSRGRRLPLAYVLGSQPFLGLDIRVTPAVLVPRPETEELVEAARELADRSLPGAQLHVLEVGTGSGCVAVALARAMGRALVYATDISAAALDLARENARRHQVEPRIRFLREDLFKSSGPERRGWADLVVSNPPYIPTGRLRHLAPEVRHEPLLALDGGRDGLDAIRAIAADAPRLLKPGGWLALEHGAGQAVEVRRILERQGFADLESRCDLQRVGRIALARRPV